MDTFSQSSTVSTIPPDITDNQDENFIDEIESVNDLFFGIVQAIEISSQKAQGTSSDDDDSNNDVAAHFVLQPELRDTDLSEQSFQLNFKTKTCGCVRLHGKPCSTLVDWNSLVEYKTNSLALSHSELDLLIKIQLFRHRSAGEMTTSRKHSSKDREKPRQEYFFSGQRECRETFAFVHRLNRKKVDGIARSLDSGGLIPRTDGNTGKSPKHSLTVQDVENVKQFLVYYGKILAAIT